MGDIWGSITPDRELADELADSKCWESVDDEVVDKRLKHTPKSFFLDIISEADDPDQIDERFGSGKWEGLRKPEEEKESKSGVCNNGEAVSLLKSVGVWG